MDVETNPEQLVAEMRSRMRSDLLAQAETFESEVAAALEETRGMQGLAAREAAWQPASGRSPPGSPSS